MIAELASGMAGARAAYDIAKGINSLNTETERNQAVIDIQRSVLEMQQALMAANELLDAKDRKIAELGGLIAARGDWFDFAQGYELRDAGEGVFAYLSKAEKLAKTGEPEHWLCPTCFDRGII